MRKQDGILLAAVMVALVLIRVFFEAPNFNPLGAIALMGGFLFGRNIVAAIVPIAALLLGDIILGLSSPTYLDYILSPSFASVYLSFGVIIALGMYLSKSISLRKVLGGSILAAVLFFLITNAVSCFTMPQYSNDFSGLIASYEAGLPFFRATLLSQVLFSLGIYGIYSLASSRKTVAA